MIIIGDVHGCYKTLLALLKKIPQNEEICFVGDLIDRGPNSKAVIDLVKNNNFHCVLGNHEQSMIHACQNYQNFQSNDYIDYIFDNMILYNENGSVETLYSYNYLEDQKNIDTFLEHLEWLKTLHLVLEFEDIKNENNRSLVVSHSSVANVYQHIHKKNLTPLQYENIETEILWNRNKKIKDIKSIYNVFGHTPLYEPFIQKSHANIDTACVYHLNTDMAFLTALQYPEMQIFTQINIED